MKWVAIFLCFMFSASGLRGIEKLDATRLAMEGRKLSIEEATALEKSLEKNPDDLTNIAKLLGYYSVKTFSNDTIKGKKRALVLFMIRKYPENPILGIPYGQLNRFVEDYPAAEREWLEQLKKATKNPVVVENAAKSFMTGGNIDLAIEYLKKALELDKKNVFARNRDIGNAYMLKAAKSGFMGIADTESTKKALEFFETACAAATTSCDERDTILADMAKAAFKCGETDKAAQYAALMLEEAQKDSGNWNSGNLFYYGNLVSGMLALKKGNIEEAEKYLLEAGNSKGSPQLNSFGPGMALADALFKKGKRATVLEFLKRCSKFWQNPKCKRWIKEMEENKVPDFSGNLYY